jgi:hypothetical protein
MKITAAVSSSVRSDGECRELRMGKRGAGEWTLRVVVGAV